MKKYLILVMVILLSSIAFSKENTKKEPKIKFLSNRVINVGQVKQDSILSVVFEFENTGTDTLRIVDILKSCNCTSTELSKEKFAAKEKGYIEVNIDTKGKVGENKISTTITTNTAQADYVVHVFVDVIPKQKK